jgi:hypothetical protein
MMEFMYMVSTAMLFVEPNTAVMQDYVTNYTHGVGFMPHIDSRNVPVMDTTAIRSCVRVADGLREFYTTTQFRMSELTELHTFVVKWSASATRSPGVTAVNGGHVGYFLIDEPNKRIIIANLKTHTVPLNSTFEQCRCASTLPPAQLCAYWPLLVHAVGHILAAAYGTDARFSFVDKLLLNGQLIRARAYNEKTKRHDQVVVSPMLLASLAAGGLQTRLGHAGVDMCTFHLVKNNNDTTPIPPRFIKFEEEITLLSQARTVKELVNGSALTQNNEQHVRVTDAYTGEHVGMSVAEELARRWLRHIGPRARYADDLTVQQALLQMPRHPVSGVPLFAFSPTDNGRNGTREWHVYHVIRAILDWHPQHLPTKLGDMDALYSHRDTLFIQTSPIRVRNMVQSVATAFHPNGITVLPLMIVVPPGYEEHPGDVDDPHRDYGDEPPAAKRQRFMRRACVM